MRFLIAISVLALLHPVRPLAAQSWRFEARVDEMDDVDVSRAWVGSTESGATNSRLVVQCQGRFNFDVYIDFGVFMGSDGFYSRWRFDDLEPTARVPMSASTDGSAGFIFSDVKWDFVESLKAHSRVLVEGADSQGTLHRIRFPLAGSSAAIGRLRCLDGYLELHAEGIRFQATQDSMNRARRDSVAAARQFRADSIVQASPGVSEAVVAWSSLEAPRNTPSDTARVLEHIRRLIDPETGLDGLRTRIVSASRPMLVVVVSNNWDSAPCDYRAGLRERLTEFWWYVWRPSMSAMSLIDSSGEEVEYCN